MNAFSIPWCVFSFPTCLHTNLHIHSLIVESSTLLYLVAVKKCKEQQISWQVELVKGSNLCSLQAAHTILPAFPLPNRPIHACKDCTEKRLNWQTWLFRLHHYLKSQIKLSSLGILFRYTQVFRELRQRSNSHNFFKTSLQLIAIYFLMFAFLLRNTGKHTVHGFLLPTLSSEQPCQVGQSEK